ncbi:hypothetical protein PoB_005208500 [Plakobranchus ocellatus]|uniref:Uncharacterized protein n=1 Tax=Plakobranchus ocellatus TaxID=259542 RepID=A0AAV4C1S7_9GAST|nr:hypothetical protein PoB_005208500 [Plakobranchus ocellatus]
MVGDREVVFEKINVVEGQSKRGMNRDNRDMKGKREAIFTVLVTIDYCRTNPKVEVILYSSYSRKLTRKRVRAFYVYSRVGKIDVRSVFRSFMGLSLEMEKLLGYLGQISP